MFVLPRLDETVKLYPRGPSDETDTRMPGDQVNKLGEPYLVYAPELYIVPSLLLKTSKFDFRKSRSPPPWFIFVKLGKEEPDDRHCFDLSYQRYAQDGF